jgi:hypothetical protein
MKKYGLLAALLIIALQTTTLHATTTGTNSNNINIPPEPANQTRFMRELHETQRAKCWKCIDSYNESILHTRHCWWETVCSRQQCRSVCAQHNHNAQRWCGRVKQLCEGLREYFRKHSQEIESESKQ